MIAAIILAAGGSSRLGRAKQTLRLGNQTLLGLVIERLLPHVDQTHVVVGSRVDEITHSLRDQPVEIVENADWAQGMSTSIRAGIGAIGSEYEAVLIAACDQPLIPTEHYAALLAQWRTAPTSPAATDYGDGTVGVPAVFPAASYRELQALSGDRGARSLLGDANTVLNADARLDIDTQADFEKLVNLPAERRGKHFQQ